MSSFQTVCSIDGFSGGSDSYLQFWEGCTYRAPVRYVTKTWSVVLLNEKIHILLSHFGKLLKPGQSFRITLYVCTYVCMCIHTHTHTHTHMQERERERAGGVVGSSLLLYIQLLYNPCICPLCIATHKPPFMHRIQASVYQLTSINLPTENSVWEVLQS